MSTRVAGLGHQATDLLFGEGTATANALGPAALDETRLHRQADLRKGAHSLRFRVGVSPHDDLGFVQCARCSGVFHSITGDCPERCPSCDEPETVGVQGFECVHGFTATRRCEECLLSSHPAVELKSGEVRRV